LLFRVENLVHQYSDGTTALDNVSLGFEKGERIALLGTNGSGKTTLLNHFNGILKPSSGPFTLKKTPAIQRKLA
jgi:ABC-type multidrug transport system ATPase subunit